MKNLLFIYLMTWFISSCKKDMVDIPENVTVQPNGTSELICWDDLPDEYKNAVRVSPEEMLSKREGRLPIDPYKVDEVFNPFNLSAGNFSMTLPPDHIKKIAIGRGKNGVVSHITVWYTTGSPQSILYVVSSGGSTSTPMVTYTVSDGEYIRGFSGRSNNGTLNGLTIYTNNGNVSVTGTTGTSFSYFATPGSFIREFSGNAVNSIGQLKATSRFLPWKKISGSNARDIAVDQGTAYMVNRDGILYQMAIAGTSWSRVTGAPAGLVKIAAYEGGYLCAIASNGKIYNCDRFTRQWSERIQIGGARDIVINGQGQIFVATAAGIYYNNGNQSSWIHYASGNYVAVSCGRVSNIRAIDINGNIFSFGAYGGQMPGSNGKDIHMEYDGMIWLVNRAGKVSFIHYPSITSWKQIPGSNVVRIAAVRGLVMMINTEGDIYKLEYDGI